jgi:hypothetical protein
MPAWQQRMAAAKCRPTKTVPPVIAILMTY